MVCLVLVLLFARAKNSSTHMTKQEETKLSLVLPVVIQDKLLVPSLEKPLKALTMLLIQANSSLTPCGSQRMMSSKSSTVFQLPTFLLDLEEAGDFGNNNFNNFSININILINNNISREGCTQCTLNS